VNGDMLLLLLLAVCTVRMSTRAVNDKSVFIA